VIAMMLAAIPPTEFSMRKQILGVCRAAVIGAVFLGAVFGSAQRATAESVYRCHVAGGALAFQDRPCASGQVESKVEIAPAPPVAPSPQYGVAAQATHPARERGGAATRAASVRGRSGTSHEALSYECRAANGDVFYRHGACPKQVTAKGEASGKHGGKHSGNAAQTYSVSATALPRGEACRRMSSAGSIGRAGHEHDETVSSYDRNLGRDPCRYL
jgi:hypothetical protein